MIVFGSKIYDWTVLEEVEPYISPKNKIKHRRYSCHCICGTIKTVRESSLKGNQSQNCGCRRTENAKQRLRTHGNYNHRLYARWWDMHRRCQDHTRKDYIHYGGRGIRVCIRWLVFENFLEDMGSTFQEGLELDRIDVDGDYTQQNCRWTTRRNQVINKRLDSGGAKINLIEFNGKILCLSQWADETGIPARVLSDRLTKLRWDVEKALTTPVRKRKE